MKGKEMTRSAHLILFLILLFLLSLNAMAQQQPQEFTLPAARIGEDYRAEIESVLREKYQLRLESGNSNRVIRWTISLGEVPTGLSVQTDGTIIGRPGQVRTGIYQFSLKVVDTAVRDDPLELQFSLEVKAERLRLTRVDGSSLVSVNSSTTPDATPTPQATPAPVTGRVTAINEQIFTNADEFTPDQIRRAVKRVVDVRAGRATAGRQRYTDHRNGRDGSNR